MPDCNKNLWAPWRMEYIRSLASETDDSTCFLCRYWNEPQNDAENFVVRRYQDTFIVMNRFPYTNGHLLVALAAHKPELTDLDDSELIQMTKTLRDGVALLRQVTGAQGFNIGYNIGRCAGAGLPGHLHAHIVPRWSGDTNFMAVIGDTRVISESLQSLHAQLTTAATSRCAGSKSLETEEPQ
ncbi:MAG: HIT domain-containing protein [Planctomycetota bacterium]